MTRRHELTDAEWSLLEPHLPPPSRGRAWADHRRTINGVLYWAATGVQWRDLPERFGPWQTVYERFRRWRDDGTWGRLLAALQASADRAGLIDWSLFCVDSTTVRASRSAAGGEKPDRRASRPTTPSAAAGGGFSTKLHLVVEGGGSPLAVLVTVGQVHESTVVEKVVGAVRVRRRGRGRPCPRPAAVAGDKGYSHPRIRRYLAGRGIRAVIPRRSDQRPGDRRVRFDRAAYRRVATRYEKLAASYTAVVQVACIRDWLRRLTRPLSDTP